MSQDGETGAVGGTSVKGEDAVKDGIEGVSSRQQSQRIAVTATLQVPQQPFCGFKLAFATQTPAINWVIRTAAAIHRRIKVQLVQILALTFIVPQRV